MLAVLASAAACVQAQEAWRAQCDVWLSEERPAASFVIEVHPDWSPKGAARFKEIVEQNVWADAKVFRVVPGFVAQWGIPAEAADAQVWRDKRIKDDPHRKDISNLKYRVTFAKGGPSTRTTQVFVNLDDNVNLDAMGFPPFGFVVEGTDVVESFNSQYGQRPNQGSIQKDGNMYLDNVFPGLSYIKACNAIEWSDKDDEL
eukprot:gene20471-31518_t